MGGLPLISMVDGARRLNLLQGLGKFRLPYSALPWVSIMLWPAGNYCSSKAAVHCKSCYCKSIIHYLQNTAAMGGTLAQEVAPFNIRVLIVAPGAFRTENIYINKFDTWTNPIPDYEDRRADALATYGAIHGKQPGDPVKAMNVVVDTVRGEGVAAGREWPSLLVLGEDAERDIRDRCTKILKHLDEWQDVIRDVNL